LPTELVAAVAVSGGVVTCSCCWEKTSPSCTWLFSTWTWAV
jgi:hypothetical protein